MTNENLSRWFGLSYASFLTMPRVLMEAMPDKWQEQMAKLLFQYDDTFPNRPDIESRVQAVQNGKLIPMPDGFKNYRHPDSDFIDQMRFQEKAEPPHD